MMSRINSTEPPGEKSVASERKQQARSGEYIACDVAERRNRCANAKQDAATAAKGSARNFNKWRALVESKIWPEYALCDKLYRYVQQGYGGEPGEDRARYGA